MLILNVQALLLTLNVLWQRLLAILNETWCSVWFNKVLISANLFHGLILCRLKVILLLVASLRHFFIVLLEDLIQVKFGKQAIIFMLDTALSFKDVRNFCHRGDYKHL